MKPTKPICLALLSVFLVVPTSGGKDIPYGEIHGDRGPNFYLCKTRCQREIEATDRQIDQLEERKRGLTIATTGSRYGCMTGGGNRGVVNAKRSPLEN